MKIKPEHYAVIKDAFSTIKQDELDKYKVSVLTSGKFKDFEKRIRWDIFHGKIKSEWVCKVLYLYVNDDHIDTALKQAVKDCGLDVSIPNGVRE